MGVYLAPDLTQISEPPPEGDMGSLIKRNVLITTDDGAGNPLSVDLTSAIAFETNTGVLATDECGDPFPIFTATPEIQIRPLGDFTIILVPTALDATSDIVNVSTGGHKFKLYIGTVGQAPTDGNYKCHMAWFRC